MITYDDMMPGRVLGSASILFDAELLDAWCVMFPEDRFEAPAMPAGIAVMVMMRAYMQVLADRPPGNIHAGQNFRIVVRPLLGDVLTTRITCVGREIRNDRRWVRLETTTASACGVTAEGRMTLIWAR